MFDRSPRLLLPMQQRIVIDRSWINILDSKSTCDVKYHNEWWRKVNHRNLDKLFSVIKLTDNPGQAPIVLKWDPILLESERTDHLKTIIYKPSTLRGRRIVLDSRKTNPLQIFVISCLSLISSVYAVHFSNEEEDDLMSTGKDGVWSIAIVTTCFAKTYTRKARYYE